MVAAHENDRNIIDLREAVEELKNAVSHVRDLNIAPVLSPMPPSTASSISGWNFDTFEKFINQRFIDLSMQLRERYEAQQTGVTAALAAAEKAVNAALIAAEKAVDKAERAQDLRNQVANEFRSSLSDLSGLMWTKTEGQENVGSLRRELTITLDASVNRIGVLEVGAANIQGRIWAVSMVWAIIVLGISVGVRFVGH